MDYSAIKFLSQNSSRKVRKLLGQAYLHEYRIPDALDVYLSLLHDYPADVGALIVLGNLYRLAENPCAAERLYWRALETCPVHPLAKEQLNLLHTEAVHAAWDEHDPLKPAAIAQLTQRLESIEPPERRQAVREAADLLDRLASEERPSQPLGKIPTDMQQLMPALIEQNIRQARADGLDELAEALQSLQISLSHHVDDGWS